MTEHIKSLQRCERTEIFITGRNIKVAEQLWKIFSLLTKLNVHFLHKCKLSAIRYLPKRSKSIKIYMFILHHKGNQLNKKATSKNEENVYK